MAGSGLPLRRPSAVIVALLLAGAYLCINATWSLSPSTARVSLVMLFLFIAAVHVTLQALDDGDADAQRAMAIGLYAAMAIVGAVICIEAFSGQWLRQQLMALAPALRPDLRHMVVEDGRVTFMQPYLLNRSIAALTLLLWPTLLVIVALASTSRQRRWLLAGLVPVVAAILGAQHATSKIAFVGAAAAFAAFLVSPGIAKRAIAWGWVATIVLVVPLATLAFQNELHLSTWMPRTAKHRIVIWGHTSQLIAKAPILGAGIHTARALHDPNDYDVPPRAGLGVPPHHRPAQPQRLPADLVRGRRRRGRLPARHRPPGAQIAGRRAGRRAALSLRHLRRLRPDGRLELQPVAALVHGRAGARGGLRRARVGARRAAAGDRAMRARSASQQGGRFST